MVTSFTGWEIQKHLLYTKGYNQDHSSLVWDNSKSDFREQVKTDLKCDQIRVKTESKHGEV